MKKWIPLILAAFMIMPVSVKAGEPIAPCAEILGPTKDAPLNARGVALMYHIKRELNDERTSLSVHALHMPKPSAYGDYDRYEVLANIPNVISWRFNLTEYAESAWAGKLDEISGGLKPSRIQVRTINSRTNRTGPVVLQKSVDCRKNRKDMDMVTYTYPGM
ncbi:MAG TPA: hypothetical protein VIG80_01355 [Bacillaceae bacterium]